MPASPRGGLPGARYAMRVIHPGSPALRVRYRQGVLVGPLGAPDWLLHARAVVDLPPPPPGRTRDELRVAYVLAANLRMARDGDPLWEGIPTPDAASTPAGWTWAQLADSLRCALVPVELHAAVRHFGGVTTRLAELPTGLQVDPADAEVEADPSGTVDPVVLDELGRRGGRPFPEGYREFLGATNGARPQRPGVLANYGFVVDQPFFGLGRPDRLQDLWHANAWLADRITPDFLAIGYVQGGLLAVRMEGADRDSVWYLDDDDPRATDDDDAAHICGRLLSRCADSIEQFWSALRPPPRTLCELADEFIRDGGVRQVRDELIGAALPASRRGPGQPPPRTSAPDPLVSLFEVG